jgi:sugar-specific transcriptional regulator TrmB
METKILEELGLTDSEVKVFLTLLKIGPAKAGDVINKSNLQNPVVHRAFHSLIEKGIITYSFEGKIKYYQSIDPTLLLNLLDEKRIRLETIIPELKKLHEIRNEKTKATIHQGKKGVRKLLNYLLNNCEKEFLSYGAPKKSLELLEDFFWKGFHNNRINNKISARMIFNISLKDRAKELNLLSKTTVRTTSKEFEELVETIIVKDKVGIIIYLNDPIGILIEEELAAKSYRNFFEIIWESCIK